MTREVKIISPEKSIKDAAGTMTKFKIGSLIVVKGERPIGVVTEGDVSRAVGKGLDSRTGVVSKIMSRKLVVTTPDERIEAAAKQMAEANVKKLPVISDGKLVGILTQTDIVGSSFDLVTSLKEMVRARYRPPDFQP
jgi:CBS domain-containing protein